MPSRRSRSRSRSHRSYSHSRSRSPERERERRKLPHNAEPISESDYFLKIDEFRVWLKDEKDRYFDELSGEKARRYFRKFVKAWNKGRLSSMRMPQLNVTHTYHHPESLYAGVDASTGSFSAQTGYKWSFASNKSRADQEALQAAKDEIHSLTNQRDYMPYASSSARDASSLDDVAPSGSSRMRGPTLPSTADLTLAREMAAEQAEVDRKLKRKRDKAEAKDRIEDMVGPKEVGREGMLEKKRARRENDKAFREGKGDGFDEIDESTLMGGGDSFKAVIAKRDAGRRRAENAREEKANALRERAQAIREKDKATMDMLQQLAKQRFG